MPKRIRWVMLAYRLPREPSTPRIALWRRLRGRGAVQLVDNLVALPLDRDTREAFDWLADEIAEAGGEASVWISEATTAAQERALVTRMRDATEADYRAVIAAAAAARSADPVKQRRALARLRRTLRAIRARDYFPGRARGQAERAVEQLAADVEVVG